jgi:hypothetical protein
MNPKLADVTLSRIVVAFFSVSVDAPHGLVALS